MERPRNTVMFTGFILAFALFINGEEAGKMSTGAKLPKLGVGILDIETAIDKEDALVMALEAGYRMIDIWEGDEMAVKNAIVKAKVPREEITIVVKLNLPEAIEHEYDTRSAVLGILKRLQTAYIDLLLINYPEFNNAHAERWKTLISLKNSDKIKLLGVANFNYEQVMSLAETTAVLPSVVQLEINPFFQQKELVQKLISKGIAIQAYSPLANGQKLKDSRLVKIANIYEATTAQLLIQWCIQKGYSCITKSTSRKHLDDNINLGEFFIEDTDMKDLDALDEGFVTNYDPNDQRNYDDTLKAAGQTQQKPRTGRRGDDLDEDGKLNDPYYSEEITDYSSETEYVDDPVAPPVGMDTTEGGKVGSSHEEVKKSRDEF